VKEFAKTHFSKLHEINFQSNKKAHLVFEGNLEATEIVKKLEYILGVEIDRANDLVFFDEIQECPKAINSLKFFCEALPGLPIVSAGSYL
jgi:predicted AAA+ superfamily ATPase